MRRSNVSIEVIIRVVETDYPPKTLAEYGVRKVSTSPDIRTTMHAMKAQAEIGKDVVADMLRNVETEDIAADVAAEDAKRGAGE